MKIGIDARKINDLGIGTYIKNIITRLPLLSDDEYVLFGSSEKLKDYNIPVIEFNLPVYSIKEQIKFPGIIKKSGIDLFHSPHYVVPLFSFKKAECLRSMVVTVHDLIHLIFPEYLPSRPAYFYAKFMISSACRKAKKIITISENTKKDIIKYFNLEPSKIKVVYLGVSEIFKQSAEKSAKARAKYGKYLLYVGAIRPHKNILTLIESFYKLKKEKNIKHNLIIIGRGKMPYINEVKRKINNYFMQNEVLMFENLPQKKLIEFYCGSDLFVFPTLYEGFGLPVLEAMACGCPVLTSDTSSLPEVAGDAGIMVNPLSIEEISQAIYKIITNENLRNQMIQKGLKRAKLFSWEKTALGTLKVYQAK